MGTVQKVFAGAALMTATLLAPQAGAQTAEQIAWCSNNATPDQMIEGCTAMIRSRQYSGEKLAAIYNRRAIGYYLKKDLDRAIADYNQSILHDISDSDTMYNRGIAYFRKGDIDHAIADIDRAITRFDPSRYPVSYKRDYFKARGNAYRSKEDYQRAIDDYSEAIKIDPKFARAIYNRGEVRQKLGDASGAEADFELAKSLQADIVSEQ